MIRTVNTEDIVKNIKEMCIEANHYLSKDMDKALKDATVSEKSELGKKILNQLQENLKIADEEMIPICQDTGMAVIFLEVGQDVHFEGMAVEDAVNEGVRQGYTEGYLRKSVVGDPIIRENTKDNTPAVIHYSIVPGDKVIITMAPKGFGSENMSRVFMLKPADGIEGVKNAILTAVKDAGPNACPPMVVGVGIGGTFEKCALMAKHALTRNLEEESPVPYVRDLEKEMLEKINRLGIGPGGLGGRVTAMAVNIETYPTHIAGLPMAVNIKRQYPNILLYVDEAHAIGARGKTGLGIAEEQGCIQEIDLLVGTFGKALASMGAYLVCSHTIREYLVNTMRPLIFSTALPPFQIAWTSFIWEQLPSFTKERENLLAYSRLLAEALTSKGGEISQSHIIPFIVGESEDCVRKAEELQRKGFYCLPVRPPTVPKGTSAIAF